MNFFELTSPEYISDQADKRNNPVMLLPNISVPSVMCDDCGLWSSSERIRRKVEISLKANEIFSTRSIHSQDWKPTIEVLSVETGISQELLKPGAEIGMPRCEIVNSKLHDFIHPFPGIIWINQRVKALLSQQKVTGVEFCPVDVTLRKNKGQANEEIPKLWEIIVLSNAWRKGIHYEDTIICHKCNRTKFLDPDYLDIDRSTWDGSDFITLDMNPNIIVVTERICEILNGSGFTNFLCKEI